MVPSKGFSRVFWGLGVVLSGVISRVTIVVAHIRGLIAPIRTTHEPPSTPLCVCRLRLMI